MAHKLVNGIQVELTAKEIAQRQAEEQAWLEGAFDRAMADLRQRRNGLLSSSDWTQLPDTTLTTAEKTAWMNYRTELRNITNGLTNVEEVNSVAFPVKPQ